MRLAIERWYPVLLALAGCITYIACPTLGPAPSRLGELFAAILTVSSIAIGFLATAKSILISSPDQQELLAKLDSAGYKAVLIEYLMKANYWNFGVAVLSVVALYLNLDGSPGSGRWILAAWLFATIGAGASTFRVIRVYSKALAYGTR